MVLVFFNGLLLKVMKLNIKYILANGIMGNNMDMDSIKMIKINGNKDIGNRVKEKENDFKIILFKIQHKENRMMKFNNC